MCNCNKCRTKYSKKCDNTAFCRILAPGLPVEGNNKVAEIDNNVSNKNIEKVERLSQGRYKLYFCKGTFGYCSNKKSPIIMVSPCESLAYKVPITDASGNITLSDVVLSEQAVTSCELVNNKYAIVNVGRRFVEQGNSDISFLSLFVPVVSDDVSFDFYAVQAN